MKEETQNTAEIHLHDALSRQWLRQVNPKGFSLPAQAL